MSSKRVEPTAESLARETWSLSRDCVEIDALLNSYDPETGEYPESFEEDLAALAISANEKMVALMDAAVSLRTYAKRIKDEAARLRDRARAFEARADRARDGVGVVLRLLGERKVETPLGTFWLQNNPPSVDIEDESAIPAEYIEIVQTTRIKKSEILADLKKGKAVPGCKLKRGEGVRWR